MYRGTPQIIMFNGPPGVGKDTAAQFLHKHLGAAILRLTTPLERAVADLLHFSAEYRKVAFDREHREIPRHNGKSVRDIMIWLGKKYREEFGNEALANTACLRIMQDEFPTNIYAVPDLGFAYEVAVFQKCFGRRNVAIVNIVRPGLVPIDDGRALIDTSQYGEQGSVLNNRFDLELYESQVLRLTKQLLPALGESDG